MAGDVRPGTQPFKPGGECLKIDVFGTLRLSVNGSVLAPTSRKARAMLAYLALEGGVASRERLAGLLWGDSSEKQARNSLRQALFELRSGLDALGCVALVTEREHVALEPGQYQTDLDNALLAAAAGQDIQVTAESVDMLCAGYEDLSPIYAEWLAATRVAARARYYAALEAAFLDERRPPEQRRVLAEAALRMDRLSESACRTVMRLAAQVGEIGVALRAYAALYDAMGVEFDMEPSESTQELIADIKRGRLEEKPKPAPCPLIAPPPRPLLPAAALAGAPVVAVLPFRPLGPDPAPAYFAEGVLEDVVVQLSAIREPVVISSNSTRRYAGVVVDLGEVSGQLGAAYVVAGSMRVAGGRIRLALELVAVRESAVIWAQNYDIDDPASFIIHNDIALQVAATLAPKIQQAELRRSKAMRREDLNAYQLMLEARALIFDLNRQRFEQAGELLRQAVTQDGSFSSVHAALASWYGLRLGQGWSDDRMRDGKLLMNAARQAIALDNSNGRALAIYAHNISIVEHDHSQAERLFEMAEAAAPNDAEALTWSLPFLGVRGRHDEAIHRGLKAKSLSPCDPFMFRLDHFLSAAFYNAGDYAASARFGLNSFAANPQYTSNLRVTAAALAACDRPDEAQTMAQKFLDIQPEFRVSPHVQHVAFQNEGVRQAYGKHLRLAGFID